MRKNYPYLQDSYIQNSNNEKERRAFLAKIDNFANQRQYVKITLLNWAEEPIKSIEGTISSGNISKDGSSAVRRTCQLSCSVGYGQYDIQDDEADFAINKKVFLEIGIKNDSDDYLEYPILWFPQGIFFISSFSTNSSTTGSVNININLKDKMAMLNGDVGGLFPALTVLDVVQTQLPNGEYIEQKVPIYSIIQEVVNHYGSEDLNNIIIEDIPLRIRRVMKWNGSTPLYLLAEGSVDDHYDEHTEEEESILKLSRQYTLFQPTNKEYEIFYNGDDVGYTMADFVIPEEFTAAAGESVTSVLERLVQMLGNYEFFYDEMGVFHFREIRNYVNTSQGKLVLDEVSENQYLVENNNSKSVYTFDDTGNITSINVTPKYDNIKNDYIILGQRQSTLNDLSYEVRYHLAIDEKPHATYNQEAGTYCYAEYGTEGQVLIFYSEKATYGYTGNIIAKFARSVTSLPDVGNLEELYYSQLDKKAYYWNGSGYEQACIYDENKPEEERNQNVVIYQNGDTYKVKDWRTMLYLKGKLAELNGTEKGRYYEELNTNWPTVYSLIEQVFYSEGYRLDKDKRQNSRDPRVKYQNEVISEASSLRSLTDGNYYLDFINASTSSLGQYSIESIGCRSLVVQEEKINCLFQPEIPNIDILNIDDVVYNESQSTMMTAPGSLEEQRQESINNGQSYSQVGNEIYKQLSTGGYKNAAFDRIKYELYLHTTYQKQVSLTALPAFYLEPNSRITINEKSTNTYGDFVINNIGITLGPGANMSISANEVFERA